MSQIVFADESGNGDSKLPLVAACIRVQSGALESLSESFRNLREELLSDPSFAGHASMESLSKEGFHRTGDLPDTQARVLEMLQGTIGFRAFIAFLQPQDRSEPSSSGDLARVYGAILPTVLQTNFRTTSQVTLESGDKSAETAVRSIVGAWSRGDRFANTPGIAVSTKAEEPLLALADYFAGVVGASLRKDPTSFGPSVMEFRHLHRLLPDIAYLVNVGSGESWRRATIDQFPGSW